MFKVLGHKRNRTSPSMKQGRDSDDNELVVKGGAKTTTKTKQLIDVEEDEFDITHSYSTMDVSDSETTFSSRVDSGEEAEEVGIRVDDNEVGNDHSSCEENIHKALLFGTTNDDAIEVRQEEKITIDRKTKRSLVQFTTVQIREYPLIIGDNPSCELGVPITIDWKPLRQYTTSVNEHQQEEASPHHTNENELRISPQVREGMIRHAGFHCEQIRRAVHRVNIKKMERRQTLDSLCTQSTEEMIELVWRGFWNATIYRRSKQKQRNMIQQWIQYDNATKLQCRRHSDHQPHVTKFGCNDNSPALISAPF